MLREIASKYRQIIVLAVASVAIAAYVVPFNWVGIAQTQAQPSLYERLHDRVNDIQDDTDGTLDDMRDRFAGSQRAQDRIDDAQERADERFDSARDRVNDALDNGNNDDLQANSADQEENNEQTETQ
jgi:hypothetical protein